MLEKYQKRKNIFKYIDIFMLLINDMLPIQDQFLHQVSALTMITGEDFD